MKSILDVSNIVHGGHCGTPDWRISGFPMGGIRKLMGILNANLKQSEFIICFDGGSVLKKELLPTYKAGRVPNYSVIAQIDLLKEILLDCEIPFYWREDCEADDFICSTVHFLSQVHDPDDVLIYSDDRDMACCVTSQVKIRNATSNGICIDRNNYEDRVVRGERIPYNTILVHKMMYGDRSDNYPGLQIPGLRFEFLARTLLEEMQPFLDNGVFPESAFMDISIMNAIIDSLPESFTAEMKEQIKTQARLVFPVLVDVTNHGVDAFYQDLESSSETIYQVEKRHIKSFGFTDFNRSKFDYYCNMLSLNRCHPGRASSRYEEEAARFKSMLKMRAKDLSSGVMAVERYQRRKVVPAASDPVQNMQLPL